MRSLEWQGFSSQNKPAVAGPAGDAGRRWWDAAGTTRSQPARHLDGLVAFGEQRSEAFEVTWQLCTSGDWRAERLDVRVVGVGAGRPWNRTLLMERSGDGWRSRAWTAGLDTLADAGGRAGTDADPDPTAPGPPGLPGGRLGLPIADVVIDGCPLSHWAPVRRLGLAGPRPTGRRGGPGRPLATAHPVLRVRLPDLVVVLTRQRYVGVGEDGPDRALEHSFAGGSSVPLVVDGSGVAMHFDGMQRRHDTAMVA